MGIDLQRLHVKLYFDDEDSLAPEDAFRIFNAWIREASGETLIDVADYTHLERGPQTVLVGLEANYVLDNTDGRMGLIYGRKAAARGANADRLREALTESLQACRRLETDPELAGRVRFRGDEILLVANDRLRAPNVDATLQSLKADLEAVLGDLFAGGATQVAREGDLGERFTLRISAPVGFDVAALLSNLGA